jgi:hypothetical protein
MNRGLIVADCREVRTLKAALAWATQFGKLRPEIRDQVFDQTHRFRLPTLNVEARIRAAALATREAFSWQADNVIFGKLLANKSRILTEFRKQLCALDGDGLRKCHDDIRSQSARSVGLRLSLLCKEAELLQATAHRLSQDWLIYQADQRIKAAQLLDGVRAGDPSVRFFDTPTAKALVRNRGGSQWRLPGGTMQAWDSLFCEVADMRKVIRIALLALACQMGIKFAPHVGASYDMSWIYALGKMAEDRW